MPDETAESDLSVGVFDSGVGGVTVLAELLRELPDERFVYYADTANAPYGTKESPEIRRLIESAVERLLHEGIKALVLACNTATSVAVKDLRSHLSIPVIGMEPAIKPAVQLRRPGKIVILGTPVTLSRDKFRSLAEQFLDASFAPVPCPGLVERIERGESSSPATLKYLRERIEGVSAPIAAVVLGCTHYVLVRSALRSILGDAIPILDGNRGTAKQTARILEEQGLARKGGAEKGANGNGLSFEEAEAKTLFISSATGGDALLNLKKTLQASLREKSE